MNVTSNNLDVVNNSDVVWVAVKPHIVPAVLREVSPAVRKDQLFISVAAGTTLISLAKVCNTSTPLISLAKVCNTPTLSALAFSLCSIYSVMCDG